MLGGHLTATALCLLAARRTASARTHAKLLGEAPEIFTESTPKPPEARASPIAEYITKIYGQLHNASFRSSLNELKNAFRCHIDRGSFTCEGPRDLTLAVKTSLQVLSLVAAATGAGAPIAVLTYSVAQFVGLFAKVDGTHADKMMSSIEGIRQAVAELEYFHFENGLRRSKEDIRVLHDSISVLSHGRPLADVGCLTRDALEWSHAYRDLAPRSSQTMGLIFADLQHIADIVESGSFGTDGTVNKITRVKGLDLIERITGVWRLLAIRRVELLDIMAKKAERCEKEHSLVVDHMIRQTLLISEYGRFEAFLTAWRPRRLALETALAEELQSDAPLSYFRKRNREEVEAVAPWLPHLGAPGGSALLDLVNGQNADIVLGAVLAVKRTTIKWEDLRRLSEHCVPFLIAAFQKSLPLPYPCKPGRAATDLREAQMAAMSLLESMLQQGLLPRGAPLSDFNQVERIARVVPLLASKSAGEPGPGFDLLRAMLKDMRFVVLESALRGLRSFTDGPCDEVKSLAFMMVLPEVVRLLHSGWPDQTFAREVRTIQRIKSWAAESVVNLHKSGLLMSQRLMLAGVAGGLVRWYSDTGTVSVDTSYYSEAVATQFVAKQNLVGMIGTLLEVPEDLTAWTPEAYRISLYERTLDSLTTELKQTLGEDIMRFVVASHYVARVLLIVRGSVGDVHEKAVDFLKSLATSLQTHRMTRGDREYFKDEVRLFTRVLLDGFQGSRARSGPPPQLDLHGRVRKLVADFQRLASQSDFGMSEGITG